MERPLSVFIRVPKRPVVNNVFLSISCNLLIWLLHFIPSSFNYIPSPLYFLLRENINFSDSSYLFTQCCLCIRLLCLTLQSISMENTAGEMEQRIRSDLGNEPISSRAYRSSRCIFLNAPLHTMLKRL